MFSAEVNHNNIICQCYVFYYFCEFGRLGRGGGAFDRAGMAGRSAGFRPPFPFPLPLPLLGACRLGSGGGAPIPVAVGCGGIRVVCGMAGAARDTTLRLGLDVFAMVGATSRSYTESNGGKAGGGSFGLGMY